AEDGIRDATVTGVQTCALPISYGPITLMLMRPWASICTPPRKAVSRSPRADISNSSASLKIECEPCVNRGSTVVKGRDSGWGLRSEERRVGKASGSGWGGGEQG